MLAADASNPRARYVAIIADGNARWARAHGLPVHRGHDAGADTLKARIADAIAFGVQELTIYSFSTENWMRPAREVQALIAMFTRRIAQEASGLHEAGVRMRFIGRRQDISEQLAETMRAAEQLTATNESLTLYIAIDYGGRFEILNAARNFRGSTDEEFRALLYAPEMHDPELMIRTGGEQRLSNYLLWQCADCDLVFRDEHWPDFTRNALEQALAEFASRRRVRGILTA
jgi:undecaprenyl diphosphate synthase